MHVHIEEKLVIHQSELAKTTLKTLPEDVQVTVHGVRRIWEADSCAPPPMYLAALRIPTHRGTHVERSPSE